ncbi:uncharacterized protein PHACADRAFT_189377 [Phanerochaete carnosa HHB-10118-sp]|uniref:Uncharacterized protein n=1 Tax=Phanerochaete carnosa (strain HHB-10118-sp) TaxID=650164 RepID=K5XBB0_PHACS|nr:uncharacterized protein PHACADRAFT_189377 [Phanerochaete carnosa HHB-10118-sp]EKM60242.1 hypothetical protein PHACADRAFT_189377 [Phanerochaete carnosa HHB-10118-sp]
MSRLPLHPRPDCLHLLAALCMLSVLFSGGYSGIAVVFTCFFFTAASGALVNVTVDDQGVDPTSTYGISYTPNWNIGQACITCKARPDLAQAKNGTWHDATHHNPSETPQNATFDFTGFAIYVYGIFSHSKTSPISSADISFFIDGVKKGNFTFTPPAPRAHTHINGRIGGPASLVLLDYLVYSKDDGSSSTPELSDHSPTPDTSTAPETSSSSSASGIPPTPFQLRRSNQRHTSSCRKFWFELFSRRHQAYIDQHLFRASPSTPNNMVAPNHAHGLSGAMRTIVICLTTAVSLIILVLIVLARKARRHRHAASSFPHRVALPNETSEYLGRLATVGQAESPPYWEPAPSHSSASYRAERASTLQEAPRAHTSEKAAYVPAEGNSAPFSRRGQVMVADDAGEREGYVRSELAESVHPGSSLAAMTAPPMYESEAGAAPMYEDE